MRFVYPFESEQENGSIVVHFPDVPGAVTQVDKGENFDELVKDCLIAALGGYVAQHRSPPHPTPPRARSAITLDVLTSAKLALAMAMSDANMSNVALAYFGQQLELSVTTINHIKQLDTLIMNQ
jgi:hypothetical protein